MSFEHALSAISTSHPVNSGGTSKQSKTSIKPGFCQVCGEKASIINYGALSCQSCKTFFRRNALHPKDVRPCSSNSLCKVNMNTRRNCSACRLDKCFSMGMSSDLIRKELRLNNKCLSTKNSHTNRSVVDQQVMSTSQLLPALNLLNNDQLSLNSSEWTLLSNVIHAHDRFSDNIITQIRHQIEDLSRSSLLNTSYNVSNVYETIILMYKSMESFISSSPDFRVLTVNEQQSLVERNLHGVTALYRSLFFRATGIIDNSRCMEAFGTFYGSEMVLEAKRIDKQLDFDLTIIKLMLIVLAFSSNCFINYRKNKMHYDSLLSGTFRLFGSQNVYVELLWKYMIYRYGYYDSALRFFRLIEICLDLVKHFELAYANNEIHHDLVEDVVEQTKQLLINDQNEQRLLWGH